MLAQFAEKYPEEVQIVYRHFPLPNHPLSMPASQASEAAGIQGKFWEMHDVIFQKQSEWVQMTPGQFNGWLEEQASALELDVDKFKSDMVSEAVVTKVQQAQQSALNAQLSGTPSLVLNGKEFQIPTINLSFFESVLGLYSLKDRQVTYCPPMELSTDKRYTATVETEKGNFTIELYQDKAPLAVNSFIFLARNNWFDGVTFYRVLPGLIAQSGDPSNTGLGHPGYGFNTEISDLKFDQPGMVGLVNAGEGVEGSNGSLFFITYKALPELDGKYTIFGKIIDGMDVVEDLQARNPDENPNAALGDKILDITIKEE